MSVFRFKQFAVDQAGCAMKINTDGVLLGAMVHAGAPMRILDIGTGTGVIALMLAQRFPLATIDAIEIDEVAAGAARGNFENSPFAERISSYAVALGDFEPEGPYDLMVSNPPYFLHSLTNSDTRRRIARHTDMSFFVQLLERSRRWLSPAGSLQLVLPVTLASLVGWKAVDEHGMFIQREATIRSFPSHPPIRRVLAVGRKPGEGVNEVNDFSIYERSGIYSPAYRKLLKDFFLAF